MTPLPMLQRTITLQAGERPTTTVGRQWPGSERISQPVQLTLNLRKICVRGSWALTQSSKLRLATSSIGI
jgi:hypothetical protein